MLNERQTYWQDLSRGVASDHCRKKHRHHAKNCLKSQETDLSLLKSKAFKYLMLQKPAYEPTGFESDKICRASFFPRAKLPNELLQKIEYSLRFQRQLFIPDRILKGRPMTTDKAKSRFQGHSQKVHESLLATRTNEQFLTATIDGGQF